MAKAKTPRLTIPLGDDGRFSLHCDYCPHPVYITAQKPQLGGRPIPASDAAKLHERMANHIQSAHVRPKNKANGA